MLGVAQTVGYRGPGGAWLLGFQNVFWLVLGSRGGARLGVLVILNWPLASMHGHSPCYIFCRYAWCCSNRWLSGSCGAWLLGFQNVFLLVLGSRGGARLYGLRLWCPPLRFGVPELAAG